MTGAVPLLTRGQIIRAARVRARRAAEAEQAAGATSVEASAPVQEPGRVESAWPDAGSAAAFSAQAAAEPRRGLKGGPEVLGKARRTYLRAEYAGAADRRAPKGGLVRTEI